MLGYLLPLIFIVVIAALVGSTSKFAIKRIETLSAENERLRLFNAREVRRYKNPGAKVRWKAVDKATHIVGTPGSLVGAVWMQENGPPDIETGVLGKTDEFSRNHPIEDWPALETARTLNVWAWDWLLNTHEGRKALKPLLAHVAKPYTAMDEKEQRVWVARVMKFQTEFSKEGLK